MPPKHEEQEPLEINPLAWYPARTLLEWGLYNPTQPALKRTIENKSSIYAASVLHSQKDFSLRGIELHTLSSSLDHPDLVQLLLNCEDLAQASTSSRLKQLFVPCPDLYLLAPYLSFSPTTKPLTSDRLAPFARPLPKTTLSYLFHNPTKPLEELASSLDLDPTEVSLLLAKYGKTKLSSSQLSTLAHRYHLFTQNVPISSFNEKEQHYLETHYGFTPLEKLSEILDKPADQIETIASALGLEKINPEKEYTLPEAVKLLGKEIEFLLKDIRIDYLKGRRIRHHLQDDGKPFVSSNRVGTLLFRGETLLEYSENMHLPRKEKIRQAQTLTRKFAKLEDDSSDKGEIAKLSSRLLQTPLFTLEEEKFYLQQVVEGSEAALNLVIEANVRLAASFLSRKRYNDPNLDDAFQEAAIGLLKAGIKFDPAQETKFSTYATWWLRQQVTRAHQDKARTIRIPVYLQNLRATISRTENYFSHEHSRTPSDLELEQITEIPLRQIRHVRSAFIKTFSLDQPIEREDGEISILELIPDEKTKLAHQHVEEQELSSLVQKALSTLSLREQYVLSRRYGVGLEDQDHTLEELGEQLGITRERIRQIEAKAFQSLRIQLKRKESNLGALAEFLSSD